MISDRQGGSAVRQLGISVFKSVKDTMPVKAGHLSWDEILKYLGTHRIATRKDGVPLITFATFADGGRKSVNVKAVSGIVLDVDDGTPVEMATAPLRERGYEHACVSSFSHSTETPKYRIILPTSKDISPAEWRTAWEAANALCGGCADPATKDPCRIYYLPSCPADRQDEAFFEHHAGDWVDPDELIELQRVPAKPVNLNSDLTGRRGDDLSVGAVDWVQIDRELAFIPPDEYSTWLQVGMALHSSGDPSAKAKWDKWSARSDKYDATVQDQKWASFHKGADAAQIGIGTIHYLGQKHGYSDDLPPPAITPLFDLADARVDRLLDRRPPLRRWLLEDCLPLGKTGMLVAPGGTGKSQFLMQLCASVATGLPLAGYWHANEPGGVVYIAAEDDADELHRRFYNTAEQLRQATKLDGAAALRENLLIFSAAARNNLMTKATRTGEVEKTDYADRLLESLKPIQEPRLIVIDPASRFRGGEENSAEDATRFVEALEYIAKESGATVLIAHHANKASFLGGDQSQNASRGSSALTDGVRWQMNLTSVTKEEARRLGVLEKDRGHYLTATVTKNNYAPPQPTVMLHRCAGGYLVRVDLRGQSEGARLRAILSLIAAEAAKGNDYTRNRLEETFGGVDGLLGFGKVALRDHLQVLADRKFIKPTTRSQPITLTEGGARFLNDGEE